MRNRVRRLFPIRIPHSAFAICVAACNPTTTRPDFRPLPQARAAQIFARPQQVIPALAALVTAESLRIQRANPRDGYLETEWYDTRTRRSFRKGAAVPDLAHAVKLRGWADPYVPGQDHLTLEGVSTPLRSLADRARPGNGSATRAIRGHAGG